MPRAIDSFSYSVVIGQSPQILRLVRMNSATSGINPQTLRLIRYFLKDTRFAGYSTTVYIEKLKVAAAISSSVYSCRSVRRGRPLAPITTTLSPVPTLTRGGFEETR